MLENCVSFLFGNFNEKEVNIVEFTLCTIQVYLDWMRADIVVYSTIVIMEFI